MAALANSLKTKLIDLIRLRGPISVSDYMKIVLADPDSGFYMNHDVFGVKGHFTTSPEISQMFGEILGVWILQEWKRFKSPLPLRLVELGPGRGTLMADIVRTVSKFQQVNERSLKIRMIEMSPHLKTVQKDKLSVQKGDLLNLTKWCHNLEELEEDYDSFTTYIAHEFFDALPIHKFVRDSNRGGSWRELMIDYDKDQELRYSISKSPNLASELLPPPRFPGNHYEVCPQAAMILQKITKSLNKAEKGCALVCDYGFEDHDSDDLGDERKLSDRDTFRAFRNHESWPPLKDPGHADLTADVDFGYLKRHLRSMATIFGTVDQRKFLTDCGLQVRLSQLVKNASEKEKQDLISGADMMIEEMGQRYKFLAMFPHKSVGLFDGDPPAGF